MSELVSQSQLPAFEFIDFGFKLYSMARSLWKDISLAPTSDEIILTIKDLMHDEFDAEYVIVYISPDQSAKKIDPQAEFTVEFVSRDEDHPGPIRERIEEPRKRYVDAHKITEEVIYKFIELGAMDVEGYDSIIENFFIESTYLGFIALYRKNSFTPGEKRKFRNMKPFLRISLRAANYLAILEEFDVYLFERMLNNTAQKYKLTPSETFVLKRIFEGKAMKQIAAERGITIHAVKKYIKSIYRKMGVSGRLELFPKLFSR